MELKQSMGKYSYGAKRRRSSTVAKLLSSTFGPRNYSEETENEILEREIAKDDKPPPDKKIARIRRKGADILHSKQVLLAIVLLNLIDCALVLGELMLDIHYIKDIIETSDVAAQTFINNMEKKYPGDLHGNDVDHLQQFYDQIYKSHCVWNESAVTDGDVMSVTGKPRLRTRRDANDVTETTSTGYENAHAHSVWEDIAHALHKASIAILGVLFAENILKVVFMGRAFFHHKLEVFDAFIVLVSFVLDLVFLKGLTVYRIQDGILLLSFLLPWRVIRVVNSLIVAVLDHEHFRLKMMYKKQKNMAVELKDLKDKSKQFDFHIKRIERFCLSEGIPEWKVKHHTTLLREQSTVSSMASYALGGMLDGLIGQFGSSNRAFSRSLELNSNKVICSGDNSSLCSDSNSIQFGRGFADKSSCAVEGSNPGSTDIGANNKLRMRVDTGNEVFDSGRSSVSDVDFTVEPNGEEEETGTGSTNNDHVTTGSSVIEHVSTGSSNTDHVTTGSSSILQVMTESHAADIVVDINDEAVDGKNINESTDGSIDEEDDNVRENVTSVITSSSPSVVSPPETVDAHSMITSPEPSIYLDSSKL